MLLKYFYDESLAHASYLVGCQQSGEALIVDPGRDIAPYLAAAESKGLRIVGAAETHIHADFVSGALELAERTGAALHLSDEGPADWKYAFAERHGARLLKDGDAFYVGKVRLETMHTPGHTPESLSLLLTDEGGGADVPMGLFTGDFVFVGAVGRPDLLETADGVSGSAETGARELYGSVQRFLKLPDHLQVWPAHGAGSACGKGLGAVPSSTVGYERRFNPGLQFAEEQAFVDYILADQPETPPYFAEMKRVNKAGPSLLRTLASVPSIAPPALAEIAGGALVIDVAPSDAFAKGHAPGTINVPLPMLAQWAGFFVDYGKPVYLAADAAALPEALRRLRAIGIDNVAGFFDRDALRRAGLRGESYATETPERLANRIKAGEVRLIDVRSKSEFEAGHVPEAEHRFLGDLLGAAGDFAGGKPAAVYCQRGARSAIAASILQRAGAAVINVKGGFSAWRETDLPEAAGAAELAS